MVDWVARRDKGQRSTLPHPTSRQLLLLLNLLLILLSTWGGIASCTPSPPRQEIRIAAATSLAPLMSDLLAAYEGATGIRGIPVLSSSGKLAQQIVNGAPYDVFMSANANFIDQVIAAGQAVPSTRTPYALGILVLAVHPEASSRVHALSDLTRPDISRIVIANPRTAPYGGAAEQALRRTGIWPQIREKLIFAENVRQATQFISTGNVPVGLVAGSTVHGTSLTAYPLPPPLYDPILHEAVRLTHAEQPDAADAFLSFLTQPQAKTIFRRFGFRVPEEAP